MKEPRELKFLLTIDDANLILDALGQQPFQKVFALIQTIQQQAEKQINENPNDTASEITK